MIACCISVWALSGLQSGVSNCLPILTPLLSKTLSAPFLNSVALLSVGAPLIIVIVGAAVPPDLSFCVSAVACSLPTRSLSNET